MATDGRDVTEMRVAVLAGGWSDERDVSMSSATEVRDALAEAGFDRVDLLDIAEPGFIDAISHTGYDVAFVAMHGKYGEDGCIQGLLEILRIPYTFSGVQASAMAMDKWLAKSVYERCGIPTPKGVVVTPAEEIDEWRATEIVSELGLPLFVKPVGNGSSFGISKVTRASGLLEAVTVARGDDRSEVLVEEAIDGTEITVPVIGNDRPQALPVIEIRTQSEFYDSTVKYEPSELHHVIPASLPAGVAERAQVLAARAHVALGCRGCSRSDFIVRPDGTPVILETNAIPGMTAASLLPDAARHAGIPFPALCRRFVEMALEGRDA